MSHAQQVQLTPADRRLPSADPLLKAAKGCSKLTLPVGQQMRDSPIVRVLRLVERWAVLSPEDRRAKAAELRDLATEAAKLAGFME